VGFSLDRDATRQRKQMIRVQVERLIVLALLLLLWILVVKAKIINPIYAATPKATFTQLFDLLKQHSFWTDLVVTLREALVGWAVGSAAGLVAGVLLGRSTHALKVAGPYLTFFNAVPKIALAPIIILWFGIGEPSKIVTAILVVFFIVQVPTTAAVALVDPDLDTVLRTMGATEFQRFVKVYLPGILPAVFGALRLAAVLALLTVVFAEFLAAKAGLGQRLITSTNDFEMATAFALMIVLAVLALAINGAIGLVERRVLRWQGTRGPGAVVSL
jgi:NitT/TauT family transport system permease protein